MELSYAGIQASMSLLQSIDPTGFECLSCVRESESAGTVEMPEVPKPYSEGLEKVQ